MTMHAVVLTQGLGSRFGKSDAVPDYPGSRDEKPNVLTKIPPLVALTTWQLTSQMLATVRILRHIFTILVLKIV